MASEHPRAHEEGSADRQPLRRPDRPGARHQVGLPHVGHQPHPVLQLPSRGHDGERGAVNAAARFPRASCDLLDVGTAEELGGERLSEGRFCVMHLKWYIQIRATKIYCVTAIDTDSGFVTIPIYSSHMKSVSHTDFKKNYNTNRFAKS